MTKEERKLYMREYRKRYPEKSRNSVKRYYRNNKEARLQHRKEYGEAHKDERSAYHSNYYQRTTQEQRRSWKRTDQPWRYTPEYVAWKQSVYSRDDHTCQDCNRKPSGPCHAHHIKSANDHPELRLDIDNGVTLCKECHIIRHQQGSS